MRTNYGICIRVWVYRPMLRYICYYSTLMTAFLQAKKHRNTPQARLRPTSPALRATSPCRGGFGIPQSFPSSPEAPLPGATATTAASGGNREELLGPQPAGCEARTKGRSRRWEPQPGLLIIFFFFFDKKTCQIEKSLPFREALPSSHHAAGNIFSQVSLPTEPSEVRLWRVW